MQFKYEISNFNEFIWLQQFFKYIYLCFDCGVKIEK